MMMRKKCMALVLAAIFPLQVQAFGLLEGYQLAREHDPQFRMAQAALSEGATLPGISRAQLLPNVSAFASRSKINGSQEAPNFQGKITETPLDYRSESRQLQLRQPLINVYRVLDYKQSHLKAGQAESEFDVEQNRLINRYLASYLDVQLHQQNVRFAEALVASLSEVLKFARRQYQLGEGTVIDVSDAEAKLAIAEARLIESEGLLAEAKQGLSSMTGQQAESIRAIDPQIKGLLVIGQDLQQLQDKAEDAPEVRRSRQLVEIAEVELKKIRSNHLPTLDLVASKSYSQAESVSTRDQTTRQNVIGFQLNIPLLAGGQLYYQGEAGRARLERAEAERDNTRQQVQLELAKSYHGLQSSLRKIDGYVRSVQASEVLVKASRKGIDVGVRTMVDLLDAEEQLYTSRRNLVEAQNQAVANWIRLKSLQGQLREADVAELDKWFVAK